MINKNVTVDPYVKLTGFNNRAPENGFTVLNPVFDVGTTNEGAGNVSISETPDSDSVLQLSP